MDQIAAPGSSRAPVGLRRAPAPPLGLRVVSQVIALLV